MKDYRFICAFIFALLSLVVFSEDNKIIYSGYQSAKIPEINVAIDHNYPPYSFISDQGELIGISIDLWREWEKISKIKVNLMATTFESAIKLIESGKADVIDTFFITAERSKEFNFTDYYSKIEVSIFAPYSLLESTNIKELTKNKLAVKEGDSCIPYLLNLGYTELVYFKNYSDIIRAVKNKDIVLFCVDQPSAFFLMSKAGIWNYVPYHRVNVGLISRGVYKENKKIFKVVSKGFKDIPRNKFLEIGRKWYGSQLTDYRYGQYSPLLFGVLISLCLCFFIIIGEAAYIFIFAKKYKKIVNQKEINTGLTKTFTRVLSDFFFIIDNQGFFVSATIFEEEHYTSYLDAKEGTHISSVFDLETQTLIIDSVNSILNFGGIREFEFMLSQNQVANYYECRVSALTKTTALLVSRNISERKKHEQEMLQSLQEKERLLKEKEILLREVHHRVKNNLQIMGSLLTIQSDFDSSNSYTNLVEEIQTRIHALASLHELLYSYSEVSYILIEDYFINILEDLEMLWQQKLPSVSIRFNLSSFKLSFESAFPLGVLLTELVTNAYKHAFKEKQEGCIYVNSFIDTNENYHVVVKDNGGGLPLSVDPHTSKTLGFVLIQALLEQFKASLSYSFDEGSVFEIAIPIENLGHL